MPEPKRCHSCGESTGPSAKFCESCGAEQLEQATESSSVPAVRYCQACGAVLSTTVEFDGHPRCSQCGVRVEGKALAEPVPTATETDTRMPQPSPAPPPMTSEQPTQPSRSLVEDWIKGVRSRVGGLILVIIVVIVISCAFLYTEGTFDRDLAPWSLNWDKYAESIFGKGDNGGSARTEVALMARVQECADAYLYGDTAASYACYHEEYKARCSLEDFIGLRALFVMLSGIKLEDAEYRIEGVRIDGDRGYVTTSGVYVDGEPVGTEKDEDDYWLWEDGQWWGMNDNPKPCSITSGDG